jgi:hypothetical protein
MVSRNGSLGVAGRHLLSAVRDQRLLARAATLGAVALLELELAGRVECLADRIALCASANQI